MAEYHYVITVQCSNRTGGLDTWTRSGTFVAHQTNTEEGAFNKILSVAAQQNNAPSDQLSVLFYRLVPLALGRSDVDG